MSKPDEHDLFFDIEGVQDYVFPNRLEYLFGIYFEENGKKFIKLFGLMINMKRKKLLLISLNLPMTILKNIQTQKFIIMHHMK